MVFQRKHTGRAEDKMGELMKYSFYVNRSMFGEADLAKYIPANFGIKELSQPAGMEIKEIYELPYTPASRIRGRMTREQMGMLVERLFGGRCMSVSVANGDEVLINGYGGLILVRANGKNGRKINTDSGF